MRLPSLFWFCLALVAVSPNCLAWGRDGHRIVGDLAEAKLNPGARAAVSELLKGEPDPTLAGVSVWADEVRESVEKYRWTVPLHWVNFDAGSCDYAESLCKDDRCVVAAIDRFAKEMANPKLPLDQRRDALKFVVHFVGDVHQPLHAGYARDQGGNQFQISYQRDGFNLHSVWDSLLIESLKLPWSEYRQRLDGMALNSDTAGQLAHKAPSQWAEESCRIVQTDDFYPPRHKITRSYLDNKRPLADQRLKLAGDRLAELLNRELGQ